MKRFQRWDGLSGQEGLEGLVNVASYIGIAENHLNERRRFSKAIGAIAEPALRSKSEQI